MTPSTFPRIALGSAVAATTLLGTIGGTGSVVVVNEADSIFTGGTGHLVVWESGTPDLDATGSGNVISPASEQ